MNAYPRLFALACLTAFAADSAHAFSSTSGQPPAAEHSPEPAYLDKRALSSVNEALRLNRQDRKLLGLAAEQGRADAVLAGYISALDIRFEVLSSVGRQLISAETAEGVAEATAMADAVLAARTSLDTLTEATRRAFSEIDTLHPCAGINGTFAPIACENGNGLDQSPSGFR